jgi:hypothetical protein
MPRIAGSDFVFTVTGHKPIAGWSAAKRNLDKECGVSDWRLHDLRRTVATGMQKLGVTQQVVEAVLGHTSGSRGGIVACTKDIISAPRNVTPWKHGASTLRELFSEWGFASWEVVAS